MNHSTDQAGPGLLLLAEYLEAMEAKLKGAPNPQERHDQFLKMVRANGVLLKLDPAALRAQATAEAELRAKLEAAEAELRGISAALARIPALPGNSRLDDVCFMLAVLHKTDPQGLEAFKILDAAVTRKATK